MTEPKQMAQVVFPDLETAMQLIDGCTHELGRHNYFAIRALLREWTDAPAAKSEAEGED
jgi:hypothetical protein